MTAIGKGLSATVLGAALLLGTGAPGVIAQTSYVTADVNQRTGPGVQYSAVRTLPQGTAVELEGCQGSWCRISYNGDDGWIAARYLNQQGSPTTTGGGGSSAPTLAPSQPVQPPSNSSGADPAESIETRP
jgi:uncharacterized protein YraI